MENDDGVFREIFNACDLSQTGHINYIELKRTIQSRNYDKDLKPPVLWYIWRRAEDSGNNILTYKEFLPIVKEPSFKIKVLYHSDRFIDWYSRLILPPKRIKNLETPPIHGEQYDTFLGKKVFSVIIKSIPYFTLLILAAVVLCFCVNVILKEENEYEGPIARLLVLDPNKRIQVWRYITYSLVHLSLQHLSINVVLLLILGVFLELYQTWRIPIIYLGGVLSGSLGVATIFPKTRLYGASGGVYSLLFSHILDIVLNKHSMIGPFWIHLIVWILIAIGDVVLTIIDNQMERLLAHLFGGCGGLLLAIFLLQILQTDKYDHQKGRIIEWICLVIYLALVIILFALQIIL